MNESGSQQPIRDYKDLHVWQKGMQLAKEIYLLTGKYTLRGEIRSGLPDAACNGFNSIQYRRRSGQEHNRRICSVYLPCGRFSCGSRHSASAFNRAWLLLCQ